MVKKRTIKINVTNLNRKRRIDICSVKKAAQLVLVSPVIASPPKADEAISNIRLLRRFAPRNDGLALNIIFVTDTYIKKLNKTYRHKNSSTDVLCFCMNDLGADVFISSDRAAANSKKFQRAFLDELHLYVIHGILHMLGFRDGTVRERRRMERTQERILTQISHP